MAVLSAMRAHKHRLLSLLLVRAQARVRGVCGVRAACAQHAASARERRHAGGAAEGEKTSGSLGVDLPHASGDGGHLFECMHGALFLSHLQVLVGDLVGSSINLLVKECL